MGLPLHRKLVRQDSQVTEDTNIEHLREPGTSQALLFGTLSSFRSIKANPSKGGDAKPWVYHCTASWCVKTARLPKANQEIRRCSLSAFIEVEKSMPLNATARRISLNASLLLIILTCLFFNPVPAFALEKGESLPG